MNISVKCPNCSRQVSNENRYCTFCGYDLAKAADFDAPAAGSPADTVPEDTGAAYYDGPRFCPNGHDVPDPSLGFCPVCGSPLVDAPAAEERPAASPAIEVPPAPAPARAVPVRKCSCGYVCDDPGLSYCPECGLPLDTAAEVYDSGWVCACGEMNASDTNFCIRCGQPKGGKTKGGEPTRPEPKAYSADSDGPIPSGMKPPAEADLKVKSKYGN